MDEIPSELREAIAAGRVGVQLVTRVREGVPGMSEDIARTRADSTRALFLPLISGTPRITVATERATREGYRSIVDVTLDAEDVGRQLSVAAAH